MQFEKSFGQSFGAVRSHEDDVAEEMGFTAATLGPDIHFAPGHYSPATRRGKELIAHELAHVLQQSASRVLFRKPRVQMVVEDPTLEGEASRSARRAVEGRQAHVRGAQPGRTNRWPDARIVQGRSRES